MHSRSVLVLYGSETGNAQDVAEELGRAVERLHFVSCVLPADAASFAELHKHEVVLFALSTTGQGDFPLNARRFWRTLLRKKLTPESLHGVRFAVFGLGDSSYPQFNWAARKLLKRLEQLGGTEICIHGEGDEQAEQGTDAAFIPWMTELRQTLLALFPLGNLEIIPDNVLLQPKWLLRETSAEIGQSPIADSKSRIVVTVNLNKRVTAEGHWQDVRQLSLSTEAGLEYGPGDTITVYPKNFDEDVEDVLQLLGWTEMADVPIEFYQTNPEIDQELYPPLPVTTHGLDQDLTLRNLLINFLDITAIPKRSFFQVLSHFTQDPDQTNRLLEFTNPIYLDELFDYTTRPRRSIMEVLQEFSSVQIPWQWAAAVLPALRGRQFSIASGGELKSQLVPSSEGQSTQSMIELLVAIVRYRTIMRKIRRGVCTRYIASLAPGDKLSISLQRGGLNLKPNDLYRPMVMIGPGTGLAPMRSLIWERRMLAGSNSSNDSAPGPNILFFGNRNRDKDYFFREEWELLQTEMQLTVHAAFSRDQARKRYVQHLIREQASTVYDLLFNLGGIVFVCGSSGKMPQAVREALLECFETVGKFTRSEAEAYLLTMEKDGRYKQETW